jgi:hypothetical protein
MDFRMCCFRLLLESVLPEFDQYLMIYASSTFSRCKNKILLSIRRGVFVCYFPVLAKKYLLAKSHRKFRSLRVNLFRPSETLLRKFRMCIASQEGSAYYRNSNSHVFAYLLIVRKCVRRVASQSTSNRSHDTSR